MVHLRAASGLDEAGRNRVLGTLQDVTEREQSRRRCCASARSSSASWCGYCPTAW